MTLGQRICQYRKQLNISQEELGDRLGVSRQAVSKWETDLSVPDMNNLLALAREFGISVRMKLTVYRLCRFKPLPKAVPHGKRS